MLPRRPVCGSGSGSTQTLAGWFSRVLLWLAAGFAPELPHVFDGGLSQTPRVPICSSSLLPSRVYFWTMPSPLPAIQMLSW